MSKKILQKERILQIIRNQQNISSIKIAQEIGLNRISTFELLKELINEGLVEKRGNSRATRYFLTQDSYIDEYLTRTTGKIFDRSARAQLIEEIRFSLMEEFGHERSCEDIEHVFEREFMYVTEDDIIFTGINGFLLWCFDPKRRYTNQVAEKAIEYLNVISSTNLQRRKNGLFQANTYAKEALTPHTKVGFDNLYYALTSVYTSGFGRSRPYFELYKGKITSNRFFYESCIRSGITHIRNFILTQEVDACVIVPPTEGRELQFHEVFLHELDIHVPILFGEKNKGIGISITPQKSIKGSAEERIKNANRSIVGIIGEILGEWKHLVVIDDNIATGATPNAVCLRIRERGFTGKLTIISLCGTVSFNDFLTEKEA